MTSLRVLLDTSARREGVTHGTVMVPKTLRWGEVDITAEVPERRYSPPDEEEEFRIDQIPYLGTVATLSRLGRVRLFSYFELSVERWRNSELGRGYLGYDLFEGIEIEVLPSQFPRAVSVDAFSGSQGITKPEHEAALLSVPDARFKAILKQTGPRHVLDAFHFWTAETHQLDAFLTMDKKFLNVYTNTRGRLNSRTEAWSPKDLCQRLGEGPADLEALAASRPPFS